MFYRLPPGCAGAGSSAGIPPGGRIPGPVDSDAGVSVVAVLVAVPASGALSCLHPCIMLNETNSTTHKVLGSNIICLDNISIPSITSHANLQYCCTIVGRRPRVSPKRFALYHCMTSIWRSLAMPYNGSQCWQDHLGMPSFSASILRDHLRKCS